MKLNDFLKMPMKELESILDLQQERIRKYSLKRKSALKRLSIMSEILRNAKETKASVEEAIALLEDGEFVKKCCINLTRHVPSEEQVEAGVYDHPSEDVRNEIRDLLTFEECPSQYGVFLRAERLGAIAAGVGVTHAMIGGAPYLMAPLERALLERGITPLYSFSVRDSTEVVIDGKTVKQSVFEHRDFIEVTR